MSVMFLYYFTIRREICKIIKFKSSLMYGTFFFASRFLCIPLNLENAQWDDIYAMIKNVIKLDILQTSQCFVNIGSRSF